MERRVWAKMTPLVTGGDDFRPVSIAFAPDGSLYVTDWVDKSYPVHGKGRIWHISAIAATKPNRPTDDGEAIHSPHRELREQAARRLAGDPSQGRALLRQLALHDGDARTRATAISALADVADVETDFPAIALSDPSLAVRALAVRSMPATKLEPMIAKLIDSNQPPAVRAEGLRRDTDPSTRDAALAALDEPDPFLRQAARQALGQMPSAIITIDPAKLPTPHQRLGLMLAPCAVDEPAGRKLLPGLLNDPDPAIRFAAIEWIGEERIKALRPRIAEILNGEANTRELFESCVAALELIDGTQRPDEFHGEQYVVHVLTDAHTSNVMRRLALRMIRPDHPALTIDRLKSFLASPDEPLRTEAIRSLRDSPRPARIDLLAAVAGDKQNPSSLRAEAIVGLANADSQRDLLMSLAMGGEPTVRQEALRSLRGASLTESQRSRLAVLGHQDRTTADLVSLVLRPPAVANPPRHDVDAWLKTLEGPSDPAAGERIFFHPRAAGCFRCHQIHGRGGHVGPDLSSDARLLGAESWSNRSSIRAKRSRRGSPLGCW